MAPTLVMIAEKLDYLIKTKHQYACNIDTSTKYLIQLILGQPFIPTDPQTLRLYSPSKEGFQFDLTTFARLLFSQASLADRSPVASSGIQSEELIARINNIDKNLATLGRKMDDNRNESSLTSGLTSNQIMDAVVNAVKPETNELKAMVRDIDKYTYRNRNIMELGLHIDKNLNEVFKAPTLERF